MRKWLYLLIMSIPAIAHGQACSPESKTIGNWTRTQCFAVLDTGQQNPATLAYQLNITSGSLLVLSYDNLSSTGVNAFPLSVSDTKSNTWTCLGGSSYYASWGNTSTGAADLCYAFNSSSGADTVTVNLHATPSSGVYDAIIFEFTYSSSVVFAKDFATHFSGTAGTSGPPFVFTQVTGTTTKSHDLLLLQVDEVGTNDGITGTPTVTCLDTLSTCDTVMWGADVSSASNVNEQSSSQTSADLGYEIMIGFTQTPNTPVFSYSPNPVAFGTVVVGNAGGPTTVTITNTGGASLTIGTLSSNNSVYTLSSDLCSSQTVTAGSTCTFKVTFTPTVAGAANSTITVPDNAGNPDSVSVTGTGNLIVSNPVFGTSGASIYEVLGIK